MRIVTESAPRTPICPVPGVTVPPFAITRTRASARSAPAMPLSVLLRPPSTSVSRPSIATAKSFCGEVAPRSNAILPGRLAVRRMAIT